MKWGGGVLFITIWNTAKILNQTAQGNVGHGHKQLNKPLKNWWILRHKANPTGIFRDKFYRN
jgi:hypothetical protein